MSGHPDLDPPASAGHAPAQVIEGRPRDLGGFSVRRVLPAPFHRAVGPFVFFDHIGPAVFEPGRGLDVRPHPHIGLATVTYLFDGEILHRDSLGYCQPIRPGDINWMTAGRGIAHSERTAPELRRAGSSLHGIQSWVGLPVEHEEAEPSFVHHPAATLPVVRGPGVTARVLVGEAFGARSPVATFSPILYVDVAMDAGASLRVPGHVAERGAYVALGSVLAGADRFEPGALAVFAADVDVVLRADQPARLLLLGGAPLDGPRHIVWNFVSSSRERIEEAKAAWREERWPLVPGDEEERIPLPD